MVFQDWGVALTTSLQNVWFGILSFVPTLIIALIIFAIGWILAMLVEKLVESVFRTLKVDAALKSAGMEDVVKRAGYSLNAGVFVGTLVRWFVIVVFLMASFEVLGLNDVNLFLQQVINYLPQVVIAVLILMVSAVVAHAMEKVVIASSKAGHIRAAEFLGKVTKWSIWIFAILAALVTLGIASQLIQMMLTAIFAGAALAIGLSFGLGGKEFAQKTIEKATNNLFE
ncbi:MAG: hypothetical protein WCV79_00010 [Candidatus Paceibacterota bacterium]